MKYKFTLPYDQTAFKWIQNHYDIHLNGLCTYYGELFYFITRREIDQHTMNDNCPCCGIDGTDYGPDCNCNDGALVCDYYQMSWFEKAKWLARKKAFELCVGDGWTYKAGSRGHYHIRRPAWLHTLVQAVYYNGLHYKKLVNHIQSLRKLR